MFGPMTLTHVSESLGKVTYLYLNLMHNARPTPQGTYHSPQSCGAHLRPTWPHRSIQFFFFFLVIDKGARAHNTDLTDAG